MIKPAFTQVLKFNKSTDIIKAKMGDTILVLTDSAYVLSGKRADYLNDKLAELDTIKGMYSDQSEDRRELIDKIEELDHLILNLRDDFIKDTLIISNNLKSIISDLDAISMDLRKNNEELKTNNIELQKRVIRLEQLIGELKKQMRGIWWNGIADKILAFGAGIVTGAAVILIL